MNTPLQRTRTSVLVIKINVTKISEYEKIDNIKSLSYLIFTISTYGFISQACVLVLSIITGDLPWLIACFAEIKNKFKKQKQKMELLDKNTQNKI